MNAPASSPWAPGGWHFARHYLEMPAAMFAPALALIPLMLLVMLRRRSEYSH